MEKLKIAQYIAIVATIASVAGLMMLSYGGGDIGTALIGLGMMVGIASYIFGGFKHAVKMSGRIAKFGWVMVPFPFDLVTVMIAFMVAILVFCCIPIIPIRQAIKENAGF